ncbi:MAG: response regulator [Bacteroidota bacterium]
MLKGNLIKIAIVDDDEDDYFIIASYIKEIQGANLYVDWIGDYQEAIEKITQEAYNIYLIDYRLGNETGLSLLQEAMSGGCEDPIVLLTGKGNREIDIRAMQSGATDYLVKSELTTEKLERCIRYSLERANALKELKDRENKYRNLFEGSKDAVFITDQALNLVEVNHAASLLFGRKTDELISRNLCEFIRNDEQKKHILRCLDQAQPINDLEMDIENSEGGIKPCLFSFSFRKTLITNGWCMAFFTTLPISKK